MSSSMAAITWLEEGATSFSRVFIEGEFIGLSDEHVFSTSVDEMKADMQRNKVDLDNLTLADLGVYASPEAALKLSRYNAYIIYMYS